MSKTIQDALISRTGDFSVIEPTEEGVDSFGTGNGSELLEVSREDVKALLAGKAWAFEVNGGEYAHFVVLKRDS
jgi:hypothetical protein